MFPGTSSSCWHITEFVSQHSDSCSSNFKLSIRELAAKLVALVPDLQSATCETIMQVLEENNINHEGRIAAIYSAKTKALQLVANGGSASSSSISLGVKRKQPERSTFDARVVGLMADFDSASPELWRVSGTGAPSFLTEKQALLYCIRSNSNSTDVDVLLAKTNDELKQMYRDLTENGQACACTYSRDVGLMSSETLLAFLSGANEVENV